MYLKTLIIGMLISSAPLMGKGLIDIQEVPQITKSKENGQEGKKNVQDLNYDINRIYKQI